uniref:putative nuclease HARBI1 n=1 Tax=Epinephelus lanceolatus TaxID=310571 RepID=UPI0014489E90|nr:putative nuclease HARBI1 [Epinephelus lanceolatus]
MKFVYMFCKGMVTQLIQHFIKVPTLEEACAIAQRFEDKFHIPQIIGCVDGTHIPILAPSDGYRDFVNRKGWASYVLQGIVDDKYCFWSASCKVPGSAHDATVLRESQLFKKAHLLPKEESFNIYLSAARIAVEIAFGRLKSRWRVLLKRSVLCTISVREKMRFSTQPGWKRQLPWREPGPSLQHGHTFHHAVQMKLLGESSHSMMASNFPLRMQEL